MPRRPKPKPPTVVLLVRHGQTPTTGASLPGRAKGLHLSDKGRDQAEAVAGRIARLKKVDAIYCSPLERTRETAAPIGKAIGQRPHVERGLLECDFGAWTGKALKDLTKLPEWKTVQRYPSGFRFPDGESFVEMQTRITTTLAGLVAKHPGPNGRGRVTRRPHQGRGRRCARDAPRSVPTHRHRAVLGDRDLVRERGTRRAHDELDRRRPDEPGAVVS